MFVTVDFQIFRKQKLKLYSVPFHRPGNQGRGWWKVILVFVKEYVGYRKALLDGSHRLWPVSTKLIQCLWWAPVMHWLIHLCCLSYCSEAGVSASSVIHTSEETGLVGNFHRFENSVRIVMWTGSSNSKIMAFLLYCVNFHKWMVGAKRGGIFPTQHPHGFHVQNPPSFTSMFSSREWHKLEKNGRDNI